jgi:hypothetical protein
MACAESNYRLEEINWLKPTNIMNREWDERYIGEIWSPLGSTSIYQFSSRADLGMFYEVRHPKQLDVSFRPDNLLPPDRQNGAKLQPGRGWNIMLFVFKAAATNENRERMLADASEKYFHPDATAQCWIGIKNDLTSGTFLEGWSRRLIQQSEDGEGITAFLQYNAIPLVPLAGPCVFPRPSSVKPIRFPNDQHVSRY